MWVPHEPSAPTLMSDNALGGTASERGNAACSGILASRSASDTLILALIADADLMDQRREIIAMMMTTISKWAVCCRISTAL